MINNKKEVKKWEKLFAKALLRDKRATYTTLMEKEMSVKQRWQEAEEKRKGKPSLLVDFFSFIFFICLFYFLFDVKLNRELVL